MGWDKLMDERIAHSCAAEAVTHFISKHDRSYWNHGNKRKENMRADVVTQVLSSTAVEVASRAWVKKGGKIDDPDLRRFEEHVSDLSLKMIAEEQRERSQETAESSLVKDEVHRRI